MTGRCHRAAPWPPFDHGWHDEEGLAVREDAAAIARRIVQEVLGGDESTGAASTSSTTSTTSTTSTSSSDAPDATDATDAEGSAPTTDGSSQAGHIARRIVEDVLAGASAPAPAEGSTPVGERGSEAGWPGAAAASDREPAPADVLAAQPQEPAQSDPEEADLVGWAFPQDPLPLTAPEPGGGPRTVRWLVASLLGAIALAALFPLAVAALRSLVALD